MPSLPPLPFLPPYLHRANGDKGSRSREGTESLFPPFLLVLFAPLHRAINSCRFKSFPHLSPAPPPPTKKGEM